VYQAIGPRPGQKGVESEQKVWILGIGIARTDLDWHESSNWRIFIINLGIWVLTLECVRPIAVRRILKVAKVSGKGWSSNCFANADIIWLMLLSFINSRRMSGQALQTRTSSAEASNATATTLDVVDLSLVGCSAKDWVLAWYWKRVRKFNLAGNLC